MLGKSIANTNRNKKIIVNKDKRVDKIDRVNKNRINNLGIDIIDKMNDLCIDIAGTNKNRIDNSHINIIDNLGSADSPEIVDKVKVYI